VVETRYFHCSPEIWTWDSLAGLFFFCYWSLNSGPGTC
jgi:hypothetical protein